MVQARLCGGALPPLRPQHGAQQVPASAPVVVQEGHSIKPALVGLAVLPRGLHIQAERALQQPASDRAQTEAPRPRSLSSSRITTAFSKSSPTEMDSCRDMHVDDLHALIEGSKMQAQAIKDMHQDV